MWFAGVYWCTAVTAIKPFKRDSLPGMITLIIIIMIIIIIIIIIIIPKIYNSNALFLISSAQRTFTL